jgi:peptidoglycan/LPS O-acetylase OafA/YrhL
MNIGAAIMAHGNGTQERLTFLDFLRGIAALAVCFEHAGYRLWPHFRELTHTYFSFGKFGVTAFFLTSGFVIPYSLERANSLGRFWVSRFFRLYPLYWFSIAVTVTFLCCGVADVTGTDLPGHLVRNVLINLTMFQEYVGTPNVQDLYYTLAMEMAFYIGFSILFLKKMNRRSLPIAWLASTALATLAISVPLVLDRRVPLAGLFYFMCLAVGTTIYRNFTGEASDRSVFALLCFIALSTPVEIYCNYVLIKKADPFEHYALCAVLTSWSTAYIVFLAAYLLRAYRFPRIFVGLGTVSYSVYLLHPPLQAVVPVWRNPIYSLLAMLGLTVGVSACTYRFIEQPGIALGKRIYSHFNAASIRPPMRVRVIEEAP